MSTAKKKSTNDSAADSTAAALDAAALQFIAVADRMKGGFDAALDAGAEQARAACAFEGVEFAGRENVDAARKAGEAYYAGLKDLNDLWFETAKEAVRFHAATVKSLSVCKTPQDLSEAQMKLATSGFEVAMASANTLGQVMVKTAGEVSAPFAQFWNKSAA
ncbi:MAG: phasin family protein [Rhodospirillales bacterium]|nr:phasin family protein [Rhodospirillales bacterium]